MKIVDIIFIITWIIIPFSWFIILRLGGMKPTHLSLPVIVVASILIFHYIGFPILYYGLDEYRSEFVTDKNIVLNAWIITSTTTLLMCLGAIIARFTLRPLNYNKFYENQIKKIRKDISIKTFYIWLLCVLVIYLYISKIGINNLALTVAFNGSVEEIAISRSKMGNDFQGNIYFYNLFIRDVLIFISLIIFGMKLMGLVNIPKIIIVLTFAIVSFSLIMSSEKGLFVDFLISIIFLYSITKQNGVILVKNLIVLVIFVLIFLIPSYIYFMGDSDVIKSIISIISRVFTGSIQPVYHYLEYFPNYQNWLNGTSFPNPGGFLPFKPYNLAHEVKNFVDNYKISSVVGSMPAIYWGDIYANFGYYGLVLIPPIIGFALYVLNLIIFSHGLNPLSAGLFSWMLIHYKNLSVTSFSMYIFDTTLYIILFIYVIIKFKFSLK